MRRRFVRFGKVIAIVIELMRSFWESYVVSIEVVVVVGVQSSLVWFGWWFGVGVGECLLCLLAVLWWISAMRLSPTSTECILI